MYWSWWGMAWFWWLFWVVAMIGFGAFLVPVRRTRLGDLADPLRILAGRYAAGELSDEEYARRRANLERDLATKQPTAFPPSGDTTTPWPVA